MRKPLAQRQSVRTAMQWSDRANAGFSAPGTDLQVPLIADGPFGYRTLNVQAQSLQPDSLLARVGALCRARLQMPELAGAQAQGLDTGESAVLALQYQHEEHDARVLINLGPEPARCAPEGIDPGTLIEVLADAPYPRHSPERIRWVCMAAVTAGFAVSRTAPETPEWHARARLDRALHRSA